MRFHAMIPQFRLPPCVAISLCLSWIVATHFQGCGGNGEDGGEDIDIHVYTTSSAPATTTAPQSGSVVGGGVPEGGRSGGGSDSDSSSELQGPFYPSCSYTLSAEELQDSNLHPSCCYSDETQRRSDHWNYATPDPLPPCTKTICEGGCPQSTCDYEWNGGPMMGNHPYSLEDCRDECAKGAGSMGNARAGSCI